MLSPVWTHAQDEYDIEFAIYEDLSKADEVQTQCETSLTSLHRLHARRPSSMLRLPYSGLDTMVLPALLEVLHHQELFMLIVDLRDAGRPRAIKPANIGAHVARNVHIGRPAAGRLVARR